MALFSRTKPVVSAKDLICAFCKKPRATVKKLIAGPDDMSICDECVGLCNDLLAEEHAKAMAPVASVARVVEHLDATVVGQPATKRAMAAALTAHLRRINDAAVVSRPPATLVVGPRGSGKTALARALCAFEPRLPSYHADCSRLTETGYVGENIDNFLALVLARASTPSGAHEGLLVLDGLHHLARKPIATARDISGAEVQGELVRVLDGLSARIVGAVPRHPTQVGTEFPCDRLLVIGSWTLDEVPAHDVDVRQALVASGMTRELASRFDRIVATAPLDVDELERVLVRSLAELRSLVGDVRITTDAMRVLATAAANSGDGAFALRRPLARLGEEALAQDRVLAPIGVEGARRLLGLGSTP